MNKGEKIFSAILTLILTVVTAVSAVEYPLQIHPMDAKETKESFLNPPAVFSSAPLWVWNDMMSKEGIAHDLDMLASQHVMMAIVHPRPGLMTPYLSDEWVSLWSYALEEAKKRGMLLWIYDENSYPSGFAGGNVPEVMPEATGQGIHVKQVKKLDPKEYPKNVLAIFDLSKIGADVSKEMSPANITKEAHGLQAPKEGNFAIVSLVFSEKSPWFANRNYVDLLKPGVTEKFLELTLEPYRKAFGKDFGKNVLGSFTDEPHLAPAGGLHWTDDLDERFEKKWGYCLVNNIPSLFMEVGDWKKVRHDYCELLLDEFIKHWAIPYSKYCEKNNLVLTGHYWEHEWPNMGSSNDNMAMYAFHQVPAIDCLFNQYNEGTHGQVGNVRMVKELASIANQMGYSRRLCEIYGGGGWDIRFEDLKRIADWNGVLGVNLFDQHLVDTTLRGARKHDYPQTFSYHASWWKDYGVQGEYLTRLAWVGTAGEEINKILLIEPTTTAWMYYSGGKQNPRLNELGERFQSLTVWLSKNQIEYDLGSEDTIMRFGKVSQDGFHIGKRTYTCVVLPEDMENIQDSTLKLLKKFKGQIVSLNPQFINYVDGKPVTDAKTLAAGWQSVNRESLLPLLQKESGSKFSAAQGEQGILYHQRRSLKDGELVLLVNSSLEKSCSQQLTLKGASVEQWNLENGKTFAYPFQNKGDEATVAINILPAGSLVLLFSKEKGESPAVAEHGFTPVAAAGAMTIQRDHPNVLTLDYCSITAGGESLKNALFYDASKFAFQKNGMKENPWDTSVQYKDETIKKTFPADSGFTATFKFIVLDQVPKNFQAVVERPDLYSITVNNAPVKALEGKWYLDRVFGVLDIASISKVGENELTLTAKPMTIWHELERAYLIGDFSVEPAAKGFVVKADHPVKLGSWKTQGLPFYPNGMVYSQAFAVSSKNGEYQVRLLKWYGSVAEVKVNGKPAGVIYHNPWSLDVTENVKEGENQIEVTVIGTPKNLLGPHYDNPPLGISSPWAFRNGPKDGQPAGEKYSQLDYGLFEPFVLEKSGK